MLLQVKPQAMSIYVANGKLTCKQVRQRTGCDICINGSLYNFSTMKPLCDVKVDGVELSDDRYKYWGYGWDADDKRMTMSNDMDAYENYISCIGLLKDGKKLSMSYNKDVGGVRGRSAIGFKEDGTMVVYCFADKTAGACTPEALADKMKSYGCVDALCLDGGGSCSLESDAGRVTTSRKVANYICIWTKGIPNTVPVCPYSEPILNVRSGSRGEGAKWVQWYLNVVTDARLTVDGVCGKKTVDAIKNFQKTAGLKDDGICGKQTRNALKDSFVSR